MKRLIFLSSFLFLASCAALGPVVEKSAERAADATIQYCSNFTEDQRAEFHARVNGQLPEGMNADIVCPSDAN